MPFPNDTSAESERIVIQGYRAMPGWKKLRQVTVLTRTVQRMALTRISEKGFVLHAHR